MQVERPYFLSSIEQEIYFTKWAHDHGIKQFLFDLDNTICGTTQIFDIYVKQIIDHLSTVQPLLTPKQWRDEFESASNESFEKNGVNPDQYKLLFDNLCAKFNLGKPTNDILKSTFQKIYDTPVTFLDGAEKTLKFLKKIDIPTGIVTHANQAWTYKKYQWLDLQRYLNWEDIYIVNENGHKTSESWQDAIKYFHLLPQECAVVGDSPRTDVNPANQIGVKYCFLVENQLSWSVHQQPIHPDIRRIKNLPQIIQIGTGQL